MAFVSKIIQHTFSGTLVRADIFSAATLAVAPAYFYVSGRPMPENLGELVSLCVAISVCVILAVRLITAPYRLWLEDQARILELKNELAEPARARQNAYLAATMEQRAKLEQILSEWMAEVHLKLQHFDNPEEFFRQIDPYVHVHRRDRDFDFYYNHLRTYLTEAHAALYGMMSGRYDERANSVLNHNIDSAQEFITAMLDHVSEAEGDNFRALMERLPKNPDANYLTRISELEALRNQSQQEIEEEKQR